MTSGKRWWSSGCLRPLLLVVVVVVVVVVVYGRPAADVPHALRSAVGWSGGSYLVTVATRPTLKAFEGPLYFVFCTSCSLISECSPTQRQPAAFVG